MQGPSLPAITAGNPATRWRLIAYGNDDMTDDKPTEAVDGEVVDAETTDLATVPDGARAGALTLRDGMELLPVAQQKAVLDEYDARRNNFQAWLLDHLKEGVHYGYVPGCVPKYDDAGNMLVTSRGRTMAIPPTQWQAKPSLYKAGALLLADLLRLKVDLEADKAAWEQMGSVAGTFVIKAIVTDAGTGEVMGCGRGIFEKGEKGMRHHSAIKMAQKRAMVDGVINSLPVLADLFTQDRDPPPPSPAPLL